MRISTIWLVVLFASFAIGQESTGDPESDWSFIQRLRTDGMSDVAARELVRFARNHAADSRAPQALMDAAEIFESLEQTVMALGAYDFILRDHPTSALAPQALLNKGRILSEEGRFSEAVNVYRGMLNSFAAHPGAEEARLGLGEAQMALGEMDEAQRHFRFLIGGRAQASVSARALFDLGLVHLRAEEDSLAIVQFDLIPERYPKEPIGAFALLRSGDQWRNRGEKESARQRYQRVLSQYEEGFLKARAHLALAEMAREDADAPRAASHYRAIAEEGGSREQLEEALIGLAEMSLEASEAGEASRSASAYLEKYPQGRHVERARLLRARADRQRGAGSAPDSLDALTESPDRGVRREAWSELAAYQQEQGHSRRAMQAWRQAAQFASDGDEEAAALLAEAQIAAADLARPALASELAEEAAERAEDPALAARALWTASQSARDGGDRERALQLVSRIVDEHPLSEQATLAELTRRQLGEVGRHDPEAAASELSALALEANLSAYQHALRAGRIVRDRWGDYRRAGELFSRAGEIASAPGERALAGYEEGLCSERLALAHALDGEDDAARRALAQARRVYADAAAIAGAGAAGVDAMMGLLRLETALFAAPREPWFFDARYSPLLGGVGVAEGVDWSADAAGALRRRLEQALKQTLPREALAWLRWRGAEMSREENAVRRSALESAAAETKDARLQASIKLTRAQLEAEADQHERAAASLREVLAVDAGESALAARYLLAELHRQARGYSAASQLYAEFAGALPNTQKGERSLLLAGDCEFHLGNVENAAARYRELLERSPGSVYEDDAVYRLGTALLRQGRISEARQAFVSLVEWSGGSDYAGRALWKLAELQARSGELDAARASAQKLLDLDPELATSEDVRLHLALWSLEREDSGAALHWLDARDDRRAADAASLELRVRAHAIAGDYGAAAKRLEELQLGFPDRRDASTAARLELADALDRNQRSEDALEHFGRALADAPDSELRARALYGQGLSQMRLSRFEDAARSFEQLRATDARSEWGAQALFKLGQLNQRAQQDRAAQEAYAQLVELHPEHELAPQALRGEARAWRDMGRYEEALERYHRLLEDHADLPDGASVLAQIAYCHHEMGQHELSIAAYRRVMPELDEEERGYAQFWVADSYEQLGRFEDAAAEFLRIPYLYPKLGQLAVTAQLKAGGVYERMGDAEAAGRLYEKVLRAHGAESTWGAEATKRLDRLKVTNEES